MRLKGNLSTFYAFCFLARNGKILLLLQLQAICVRKKTYLTHFQPEYCNIRLICCQILRSYEYMYAKLLNSIGPIPLSLLLSLLLFPLLYVMMVLPASFQIQRAVRRCHGLVQFDSTLTALHISIC